MVSSVHLYSLVHFGVFTLSLFFGSYSLYINPRARTNRIFFFLALSLCIWAIGFSLSNMAVNIDQALLWRKFSGLGRITVHVILLHMIISLSQKREEVKSWQLFILYLPALILIYTLVLSDTISSSQYRLVQSPYGWVNTASGTFWNLFYTFYNILYMAFNYVLLNDWAKRSKKKSDIEQANFLKKALILTLIIGTTTDVILNMIYGSNFPQLGPILSIIPIIALFHLVRKNEFLTESDPEAWQQLLDKKNLYKLYYYASILYFSGATINSIQFFLPNLLVNGENLKSIIFTSLIMYFTGFFIISFQLINDARVKYYLTAIIVIISIPAITLGYVGTASITIWVLPLILMILSVILNSKLPLILLLVSGSLTQLFVWKYAPKGTIAIDEVDYILRILIILLAYVIASLINKMYSSRLAENIYQNKLQKLISELSFELIYTNKDNFREKMEELLEKIGKFLNLDNTFLFLFDQPAYNGHFFWPYEELEEVFKSLSEPKEDFEWLLAKICDKKIFKLDKRNPLPEDMERENFILAEAGIESLLVLPVEGPEGVLGLIGCKSHAKDFEWTDQEDLFRTMANILGNLIGKIKGEEEIENLAFYDQLTGLPNRVLFGDRLKQAIFSAERKKVDLALIFFDLDNFKLVNDSLGHAAGDQVLKEVVERMQKITRKTSSLARFAGDEFLIMLEDFDNKENLKIIAERLLLALEEPFIVEGQKFHITASMGIALYPENGNNVDMLIRHADKAMYIAKGRGKNQYAFCKTEAGDEDIEEI